MFWAIQSFPTCEKHVFLSHSSEDRELLIHPVYQKLLSLGISSWLDRHDYPYGRSSREALRSSILRCRHAIFFITDATLTQARGWCVQELSWAELLQENLLQPGGSLQNILLPLYFVEQADPRLPRSVWQGVRDRGSFCPGDVNEIDWAVNQVEQFVRREERLAKDLKKQVRDDRTLKEQLKPKSGLLDRVIRFDPQALPEEE